MKRITYGAFLVIAGISSCHSDHDCHFDLHFTPTFTQQIHEAACQLIDIFQELKSEYIKNQERLPLYDEAAGKIMRLWITYKTGQAIPPHYLLHEDLILLQAMIQEALTLHDQITMPHTQLSRSLLQEIAINMEQCIKEQSLL